MEPQSSSTPEAPPSSVRHDLAVALRVCAIAAGAAVVTVLSLVEAWS